MSGVVYSSTIGGVPLLFKPWVTDSVKVFNWFFVAVTVNLV